MRIDFNMKRLEELVISYTNVLSEDEIMELGDLSEQCLDMAARVLRKAGYDTLARDVERANWEITAPEFEVVFMNSEMSSEDFKFRLVN